MMNTILHVSVAHISEETAYALSRGKQIKSVEVKGESEFLIENISRVKLSKVSKDLARIISHALSNGFQSLHLAAEGRFLSNVPHYDW